MNNALLSFFKSSVVASLIAAALLTPSLGLAEGGTTRFSLSELHFVHDLPPPVQEDELAFTLEHERRFELIEKEDTRLGFEFHPYLYGTSVEGNRQRQVLLDPRSAYLELSFSQNWFRAGFMTFKWEGTDGLNPMEIATMKDWSDPLNSQTRASGAVAYGRSGENYDLEVAYIPWQTRSLLPGEKSAWLPRQATFPLRTDEFELLLPQEVNYRYGEHQSLNDPRKHNATGRFQLRTSFGDMAVGYYEGLADTPAVVPTLNVVPVQVNPKQIFSLLNPVEVLPYDYRVRTVSGLYSKPLGPWILRLAARYDSPIGDDENIPSWSQNTVAGFERSFDLGPNTITAILQAAWVRVPESTSLLSVRDVFNRTILLGLRYPVGENWVFVYSAMASTRDASYFTRLDGSYRLNDNWKLNGTLEAIDGPSESLLGVFGRNDRATIGISAVY